MQQQPQQLHPALLLAAAIPSTCGPCKPMIHRCCYCCCCCQSYLTTSLSCCCYCHQMKKRKTRSCCCCCCCHRCCCSKSCCCCCSAAHDHLSGSCCCCSRQGSQLGGNRCPLRHARCCRSLRRPVERGPCGTGHHSTFGFGQEWRGHHEGKRSGEVGQGGG
jgi:hypothetical protein